MERRNSHQSLLSDKKVNPSEEFSETTASPAVKMEVETEEKPSVMFYLKQRVVLQNLLLMAYMWSAVSFCYYMISFQLKYLPGDIYENSLASSGSELLAYLIGGLCYSFLKIRKSFAISFVIALVGGILILTLGVKDVSYMPLFVTLAKFGISGGFVIVYVATVDLFPTLFVATAIGICNFFSRFLTILAPQVAELDPPIPMSIFIALSALGLILSFFIIEKKK